jgi:hypothetical protein
VRRSAEVTAARFGYNAAFIVNALSFVASAAFIVPIAASALQRVVVPVEGEARRTLRSEVQAGFSYIRRTPFVRGIILVNVAWATGGGMTNLLFDQIGGHTFKLAPGDRGDWNVALLYTAAGLGLFAGMMLARGRVPGHLTCVVPAVSSGWALVVHGICFAIAGVMPSLLLMSLWLIVSRMVLGAEFGVQETLMMRVLPDEYRGRVFTTDRALELAMMTVSMIIGGALVPIVGARTMMIASGLLSASPGAVWLIALWLRRFSVPARAVVIERA